ncbi:uncharacterized protein FPRO_15839 [Fusarium proliferatum ET1]|uniref:Uncharacterized protein n=1 Tax=Fusarium proliferatum (strain ET1) TaxID=1227346 RepID=A0A1L7WA60_FUSPR|nr:uncharacterized protein FPRO_15839 [Fusarium proliferatum ET1]CZR49479.1 uncharacterized protein FPRO_15839 [Fusarium proliferatum ET1]
MYIPSGFPAFSKLLQSQPSLRSRAVKEEASIEDNPGTTLARPQSRKRQCSNNVTEKPPAKAARWLNCAAVRQNFEEAEEKHHQLKQKKEAIDSVSDSALSQLQAYSIGRMYILRTVAANIGDEIIDMSHNAIQNFLAKEHEIQELAAELAHERDTLGKDLQRACDAELKQVEDKVERLREGNRVLPAVLRP